LLLKAAILRIAGQGAEAARILDNLRHRRPEWSALQVVRDDAPADLASLIQATPPSEW
jgi:hypothetical protein